MNPSNAARSDDLGASNSLSFFSWARGSISRHEFLAGLCFLACANGISTRVIYSVRGIGWVNAIIGTFEVSAIVFVACAIGLSLVLRGGDREAIRRADLFVGAGCLIPIALPIGAMSWLALTVLGVYVFCSTHVAPIRRGAVILLAITVPMLWSRLLFQLFANAILELDARLVGWLLGTSRTGNMVRFVDGSEYLVIFPACSSLANMSLAFLCWITINRSVRSQWGLWDLLWSLVACGSVVAVNVTRLSLMALSDRHYQAIHSQSGDLVSNTITLLLVLGICILGVRRELFSRA